MNWPSGDALVGAVIALTTGVGIEWARVRYQKRAKRDERDSAVRIREIDDNAALRKEMREWISTLQERVQELDAEVATLRRELADCENRSHDADAKYRRLVEAVKRHLPDLDAEAL